MAEQRSDPMFDELWEATAHMIEPLYGPEELETLRAMAHNYYLKGWIQGVSETNEKIRAALA
jgi:hypothetical protein